MVKCLIITVWLLFSISWKETNFMLRRNMKTPSSNTRKPLLNKNSSMSVFYTNRALCNIKLQKWEEVASDCKAALENDAQSVKAHFFMGQSNLELEKFDDAIVHLSKAHELAMQQKLNFSDDICFYLRLAKRKKWEKSEKVRIQQEIELQSYLNRLMLEDKQREVEAKTKSVETNKDEQKILEEIEEKFESRNQELNSLFAQVDERRKTRDVPDFLCGKISFEIMKDPVITPSGITYDRHLIEEHIQRVGHFDPVTRHNLELNQLIPNISMREVIANFVEENGWVEEY
uniref:STIP1 homology and U box-containing protein 1 isoform X1 n=1 Tax=Ciona intestinalis TaxID=7719 RepID=UPI000EF4DE44|nr:STIP1 homology and U box-containing protein 1 isoform X1 [Ciona intestinalis]|eukprot:XP_026689714.1 STIP1 homology and U box-containing protein 1 isoform X1 [Ciona intestinalis]